MLRVRPAIAALHTRPGPTTFALAIATALGPGPAQAAFVDVTPDTLLSPQNNCAVWLDHDGDGDLDLMLTGIASNRLMRNLGGGVLQEVTPATFLAKPNGGGISAGDFDHDGDLDVFATSNTVGQQIYRNDGGTFTDIAAPPVSTAPAPFGSAWLDFDRDGDLDLLVSNHNGANSLFRNSAGIFASAGLPATGVFTESFACGDYDNDRDVDIFVSSPTGSGYLLRNDAGVYVDATTAPLTTTLTKSSSWGDFDSDGDLDLLGVGARTYLMRNDGGGAFVDVTPNPLPFVGGLGGTFVDYDNDGDLDITVARFTHLVLIRNSAGVFASEGVVGASGYDMSWGDMDADGDLDVFVTGPGQLFRNDLATGAHWLHLDLLGTVSNRSGLGARVELVAGGVRQSREVSGITSYGSQNALTVAFGLGATSQADSVIVRWPSGVVQTVTGLAIDARHTITEPNTVAILPEPEARAGVSLAPVRPNPSVGSVNLTFETPTAGIATLVIFDLQGRRMDTAFEGVVAAGPHAVTWNPRAGHREGVPAGLYLAALRWSGDRHESRTLTRRFVVMR